MSTVTIFGVLHFPVLCQFDQHRQMRSLKREQPTNQSQSHDGCYSPGVRPLALIFSIFSYYTARLVSIFTLANISLNITLLHKYPGYRQPQAPPPQSQIYRKCIFHHLITECLKNARMSNIFYLKDQITP